MENKNKDWVFLYWDEPLDVKKDDVNKINKSELEDDLHKNKTTRN